MTRFICLLAMLSWSVLLPAQTKTLFNPADLQLEWELIQNQYQGKSQSLSKLRLINNGAKPLPASGWTLYFNFIRAFMPEATRAKGFDVEHLGGDWFRLKPRDNFAGVPQNSRYEVDLVSEDWLLNRTDAPVGFYLVFDGDLNKGYPVGKVTVVPPARPELLRRSADDKTMPVTAADIFRQNEAVADVPAAGLRPVFPTPLSMEIKKGTYAITGTTRISADRAFEKEAQALASTWPSMFGLRPILDIRESGHPAGISLLKSGDVKHPEGYTLSISAAGGVVIGAATPAGMFYGIQSLKTMLPPDLGRQPAASVPLPCLEIRDEPRFGYRGLHVDVARNFQPAAEIKKLLDVMALYKMNKLHFHFSEDEGWRIEMPSLPELTQVGGRRGHTTSETQFLHPAYGSGPDPDKRHGSGYYSRAEFVDLLRYATERHIEVIPEVELPGHARAAIKAMEARYERLMREGQASEANRYRLRDPEDKSQYRSVQGYNDNVVCVGQASTYAFIERVTDELIEMYRQAGAPLKTIHLGGDEVPAGVWEKSPACQKLMQEKGLRETADLWYYFWGQMRDMLAKRNLALSGWEEAGMRKTELDGAPHYLPNPDFADDQFRMYVWNNVLGWGNEDLAYRMANAGYKVVLGPVTNLYFDMAYQNHFDEPGFYWGAYTDVDKAFSFIPFDYFKNASEDKFGNPIDPALFVGKSRLTEYGKSNILGLQGLIWSETLVDGPAPLEYMVFPKMLGLAERAWAPAPAYETAKDAAQLRTQYAQAWAHFANQLGKRELPRLDYYAGGFNYRIPAPGAILRDGMLHANVQLPGFSLRYTTDGSEPTAESTLYKAPVKVEGTVKVRAFDSRGRGSRTVSL